MTDLAVPRSAAPRPLRNPFVLGLGVLVAAIDFYGFSHTALDELVYADHRPPAVMYAHVAIATAWLLLFIAQSWFVAVRNVALHRRLGVGGLAIGAALAATSLATALIMRERSIELHPTSTLAVTFLAVPLNAALSFSVPFLLAAYWRKRPDLHRRLMVLATCVLATPALARIPWVPGAAVAWIVAALLLAAAAEDWIRTRRLHRVYLIGVPALIASMQLALFLAFAAPPLWLEIARAILRLA